MNTPLQFATLMEAFNTSSAARACIHEDKQCNYYPIYDGFCELCFDQNAQWRHRSCRTSAIHQGQEETVIGARLEIGSSPSSGGLRKRDQRRTSSAFRVFYLILCIQRSLSLKRGHNNMFITYLPQLVISLLSWQSCMHTSITYLRWYVL